MATKLVKVVTYNEEVQHIKLHYPSITWFVEIT